MLDPESDYGLVQVTWDEAGREQLAVIRPGPLSSHAHTSLAALVFYEPVAARGLWLPLYQMEETRGQRTLRSALLVIPATAGPGGEVVAGYSR